MIEAVATQPYQDSRLAGAYQRGNEMPASSLRAWVNLIASFAPRGQPRIVDIGAGTGMFAAALAEGATSRFVLGVDPSTAMLSEAQRYNTHPRVGYSVGDAGALPVAAQSFDLALLSRVIHHLPDRQSCARELQRVLAPGGVVVVRTTLAEHLDAVVYDYWPRLRPVDRRRFPTQDEVVADFHAAGFSTTAVQSFTQPVYPSLRALHDVLATRPQSKFEHLSEDEFTEGLASLRRAADTMGPKPHPVDERYDVLVFQSR